MSRLRHLRTFSAILGSWLVVGVASALVACSTPRSETPEEEPGSGAASGAGSGGEGGGHAASPGRTGGTGGAATGSGPGDPPSIDGSGGAAGGSSGAAAGDAGRPDTPGARAPRDIPDPFVPLDGDRLKLRVAQVDGGRSTPLTWYDTAQHAECHFQESSDGELRCLPTSSVVTLDFYLDAGCANPLAEDSGSSACPLPDLVRVQEPLTPDRCDYRYRIFRRGDRVTSGPIYSKSTDPGSMCIPRPTIDLTQTRLYRVEAELPPSTFVKVTLRRLPPLAGQSPIDFAVYEGEDGAVERADWVNTSTNLPCSLFVPNSTTTNYRCLPGDSEWADDNRYSDAACQKQTVSFRPICWSPQRADFYSGSCTVIENPHSIGARLLTTYSKDSTGACSADPPDTSDTEHHLIGPSIVFDNEPSVVSITEVGIGRLQRQLLVVPGGRKVVIGEWYDSTLQSKCHMYLLPGGKYRCIPKFAGSIPEWYGGYFSDVGCTVPLWSGTAGDCVPKYGVGTRSPGCPAASILYALGEKYTGKTYYGNFIGGRCSENTASKTDIFYKITPTSEAGFAEITVHEPAP